MRTMTQMRSMGLVLTGSLAGALLLSGCGGVASVSAPDASVAGVTLRGAVHGGQQPVVGATIQLYATGSTGYGSAATALITGTTVLSGAGGAFNITGDYTCPSASTPVYLVATGGNSGYTSNSAIALMAALGPCGNLSSSTVISINELTTVASVYALSPFMTGTTHTYATIGTSTGNAVGLANAMADVNVLVNTSSGSTPGSTSITGATLPVAAMNTLADIIASCINSSGGSYNDGSSCGTLYANANPGGTSSTAPNDTISALMNIAQHPFTSTARTVALYNLQNASAPFQPTLTKAPTDFTLALTFAGGSLSAPSGLAADASGNLWIANAGANTVTELAHTGAVLSGTGYTASLSTPSSIALATDGTVWVTNQGNNTVSRLTAAGAAYSGSPYSGGGLNLPASIAFDSNGTAWVANAGTTSVTTISGTGSTLTSYITTSSGALAVAINPH